MAEQQDEQFHQYVQSREQRREELLRFIQSVCKTEWFSPEEVERVSQKIGEVEADVISVLCRYAEHRRGEFGT